VQTSGPRPKLSDELVAFVHGGVAVSVATRDGDLRPAFTRAWGPQLSDDGQSLALCVIAPPGSATRANLEANGAIAIGFSPPTIARAVQLKGVAIEVREPDPDELESAECHLGAFCAETEAIGYPPELARRLYTPADFLSVTFSIDEVFDQTPGPTAGRRL
jgi:Pyridoxamine 5'-phosphate oxidase